MPTPAPGYHFVPRWRTMMLPASTASPPNFLTPRRRPALSRPLREDPPAFLCAMTKARISLRFTRSYQPPASSARPFLAFFSAAVFLGELFLGLADAFGVSTCSLAVGSDLTGAAGWASAFLAFA